MQSTDSQFGHKLWPFVVSKGKQPDKALNGMVDVHIDLKSAVVALMKIGIFPLGTLQCSLYK